MTNHLSDSLAAFASSFVAFILASSLVEAQVLLMGAVSALGTVIAALWRQVLNHHKTTMQRAEDCEKDREALWRAMADVKGEPPTDLRKKYEAGLRND